MMPGGSGADTRAQQYLRRGAGLNIEDCKERNTVFQVPLLPAGGLTGHLPPAPVPPHAVMRLS